MISANNHDGPAFHTRSRTIQCNITEDFTPQPKTDTVTPDIIKITYTSDAMPKPLTKDRIKALLQIQRTGPFCMHISKHLSKGKHQNRTLIPFYTSKDYCISMSQIQTRSSWLLSYQKHGNTQYL